MHEPRTDRSGPPRDSGGLALLEVVVAFFILGVAASGFFSITTMSAVGNTRSQDRIAALALAADKLEELKGEPFDSLAAGTFSEPDLAADARGSGVYSRTWTIADTTLETRPAKAIDVTVGWNGRESVTLRTQRVRTSVVTGAFLGAFPTVGRRGWSQVQ